MKKADVWPQVAVVLGGTHINEEVITIPCVDGSIEGCGSRERGWIPWVIRLTANEYVGYSELLRVSVNNRNSTKTDFYWFTQWISTGVKASGLAGSRCSLEVLSTCSHSVFLICFPLYWLHSQVGL